MTWRTHVVCGWSFLWLLRPLPQGLTPESLIPLFTITAFTALLPDLDASESKLKHLQIAGIKPLLPVSIILHHWLGHRGFLHSLAAWLSFSILFSLWSNDLWMLWLAGVLGFGSHLVADACTRSGIPLLYPNRKRIHFLPKQLRLTTGSQAEEVVFILLALIVFALVFPLLLDSRTNSSLTAKYERNDAGIAAHQQLQNLTSSTLPPVTWPDKQGRPRAPVPEPIRGAVPGNLYIFPGHPHPLKG